MDSSELTAAELVATTQQLKGPGASSGLCRCVALVLAFAAPPKLYERSAGC